MNRLYRKNGWYAAFRDRVSNYTAPYIMLLAAFNGLMDGASPLQVLKISGLFLHVTLALTAAVFMAKITDRVTPALEVVDFFMLTSPTSLVNIVVWGQPDAFFTIFIVNSFFYLLKNKLIVRIFSASQYE
jgi:Gpi18-like mannosyltransferase